MLPFVDLICTAKECSSALKNKIAGFYVVLGLAFGVFYDVFDALTSDRPYRESWLEDDALEYIRAESGIHFDPQMVEVFWGI